MRIPTGGNKGEKNNAGGRGGRERLKLAPDQRETSLVTPNHHSVGGGGARNNLEGKRFVARVGLGGKGGKWEYEYRTTILMRGPTAKGRDASGRKK